MSVYMIESKRVDYSENFSRIVVTGTVSDAGKLEVNLMSTKDLIVQEVESMPEEERGKLLRVIRAFRAEDGASFATMLLSEELLAEDWLKPEEDEAWADL